MNRDFGPLRQRCFHASRGFTIVELLVVISIVGILVALILPAVQQAREASRRTTCQNNLKQLGLALHSYHDTHRTFPPGWITGQLLPGTGLSRSVDRGCIWSWGAYLLPMLDQQPLHDALGINEGHDPPPFGDPLDVTLPVFLCPSDASGETSGWGLYYANTFPGAEAEHRFIAGYAKANYVAVNGRSNRPFDPVNDHIWDLNRKHDEREKGMFGLVTRTRIRDVRDGLSMTFALGEREMSRNETGWGNNEPRGAVWMRNFGVTYTQDSKIFGGSAGGFCDARSVTGVTHPDIPLNSEQPGRFSSLHNGGAFFLMAEGSVRFISDGVDETTYSLLGSMDDRQLVSF